MDTEHSDTVHDTPNLVQIQIQLRKNKSLTATALETKRERDCNPVPSL